MERLKPFGMGNPSPCVAINGVRISGEPKTMGKNGNHLNFHVVQGDAVMRAVAFDMVDLLGKLRSSPGAFDLACQPVINRWANRENVEIHVKDIRFPV
ncbi:MAG: hypothetical protein A2Z34_11460 [Planctomycetes bacterium RBG_16_59_8]|nr:MAG: hypothetical protein A2Z34_11460 [Planctomycetes bacterium RBG_16_59_8]